MKDRLKLSLRAALALLPCLAAGAAHAQYGGWGSYFPPNQAYERQLPNNGTVYGRVGVLYGSTPGDMKLYHSDPTGNMCGATANIELFAVKYCTMTNLATGVVTGDQFDVFLGGGSPGTSTQYLVDMTSFAGVKATKLYFDNNNNYVPDAGDTGYAVDCGPNTGHPYAMHTIQSTPTIIQTWYKQDLSGVGTGYIRRLFWQSRVAPDGNKFNPNWGTTGASALSIVQSEAFWCADDNGADCPVGGVWQVGAGTTGTLSDGKTWPTGANVAYGRNVWHAVNLSPYWVHDSWFPTAYGDATDRAIPFSGCP